MKFTLLNPSTTSLEEAISRQNDIVLFLKDLDTRLDLMELSVWAPAPRLAPKIPQAQIRGDWRPIGDGSKFWAPPTGPIVARSQVPQEYLDDEPNQSP